MPMPSAQCCVGPDALDDDGDLVLAGAALGVQHCRAALVAEPDWVAIGEAELCHELGMEQGGRACSRLSEIGTSVKVEFRH